MMPISFPRTTILGLPLAALILAACSAPAPPPAAPKPVRVQPAALAPAVDEASFTGAVRARVESDLSFRVGGKVLRRAVDAGQRVRAGELIAALDAEDYGLGLAAAINQQQAAQVEAEQAASDARRFAVLLAEGAISAGDAERQRARAAAARERLDQAARGVALARNRSDYAALRAPFDGVVTSMRLEVGQVVGEGQPVVSLARDGEREIVVDLPESRVQRARSSSATAALWTAEGRRFAVSLRELAPLASPVTRTYRARYRIDRVGADAPPMELGMTAIVFLAERDAAHTQPVASLPASSLHQRDGRPAVWAVGSDGRLVLVPVQLVRFGQDEVQLAGLADGQLVVTAGTQKLAEGMAVSAVDAQGRTVAHALPGDAALATAQSRGALR